MDKPGDVEMVAGGVLGALAIGEATVGAAVCPLCVFAAPVLLVVGAYRRLKA